ncbi:MAG: hypothetical protein ACREL7_15555 [Longimicrobiales bacterium]
MGVFLVFTAFIVAVPVVAEVLEGDRSVREWVSPALLSIGLFTAGTAFWLMPPAQESTFGMVGVLVAVGGLLLRGGADSFQPEADPANPPATSVRPGETPSVSPT